MGVCVQIFKELNILIRKEWKEKGKLSFSFDVSGITHQPNPEKGNKKRKLDTKAKTLQIHRKRVQKYIVKKGLFILGVLIQGQSILGNLVIYFNTY